MMTCSVCNHPQRNIIDGILAAGSVSRRTIANQFGLNDSAIQRHRTSHLTKRLTKAIERKGEKADDVFMQRHEHLYRESLQYIEDAKGAVKMQRVTAEVPDGDPDLGKMKLEDRYQAFRDVGAMAPALQTATALQRVLGDATARFSQAAAGASSVNLVVVMPRAIDAAHVSLPPGDVVDVQAISEPATEPIRPASTED